MSLNKLQIIQVAPREKRQSRHELSWREQRRAHFERQWHINPEQFDPSSSPLKMQEMEQCWNLIQRHCRLDQAQVIDLGCGHAKMARRAQKKGAHVLAVDIADNCLRRLAATDLPTQRETLPTTELADDAYDLVLCTDLIADLPSQQHRHLIAELYRICSPQGLILVSSDLDIYSKKPASYFEQLLRTETQPIASLTSHHALFLRLCDLLLLPSRYKKWSLDANARRKAWSQCRGPQRWLRRLLSHKSLAFFWKRIAGIGELLERRLRASQFCLKWMEKISRNLGGEWGKSHICIIGRRRNAFSGQ